MVIPLMLKFGDYLLQVVVLAVSVVFAFALPRARGLQLR